MSIIAGWRGSFWSEPIRRGLDIWGFSHAPCRFVAGVDPLFAGIHRYADTLDGRGYRDTAHTCYPWHLPGPATRRLTTVVLPLPVVDPVATVVHELGHVVHWSRDFSEHPDACTDYAESNHMEAFAEACTALLIPGYADVNPDDRLMLRDAVTVS